jgi:hypothetical protein
LKLELNINVTKKYGTNNIKFRYTGIHKVNDLSMETREIQPKSMMSFGKQRGKIIKKIKI